MAAGSIVGTDHRQQFLWKNNQDAYAVRRQDDIIVAVVSDGCGSGTYNEFGARIGANQLANRLVRSFELRNSLQNPEALKESLENIRKNILFSLEELLFIMSDDSRTQTVVNNFLFTLLALVITPETSCVIGIGDGVFAVNGELVKLGPFPKNEPPYIAYGGLVSSNTLSPELNKFTVHRVIPTSELQSVSIGTDGVADFDRIAGMTLPGKKDLVGPLSQFWTEDIFFKNPEAVRRRFNLINNSVSQPNWENKQINQEHGRLKDDTTLVVVRRHPEPKAKE